MGIGWRPVAYPAALALVAAFAVVPAPALAATGDITEYVVPTASSEPFGIAAGPDGNLWFTELRANKVAKVTTSGAFTEYAVPTSSQPVGIAAGPDGNLWFTEAPTNPFSCPDGNKVAKVTTAGAFTEYTVPTACGMPEAIAAGPDGNLWFTERGGGGKVAKVTTSGVFTEYTVPTASSGPEGIAAGPDGNLWFTENSANKVAKVTTSGVFTEYTVPTANSFPEGIAAGPDGNLWFTESDTSANKVAKVTTSGVFTEYTIPTTSSTPGLDGIGIAAGPDGNLWFSEVIGAKVANVTTAGVFTEYAVPHGSAVGIAAGPDGNIWFTGPVSGTDRVSKVVAGPPVTSAPTVTTQPLEQTVTAGATATFNAAASGTPTPTVQWQVSTNGGTTFSDLAGATSTTLTIPSTTVAMSGNKYRAVFTNSAGTATSNPATLTVLPAMAVLPAMSNQAYGGYTTAAYIQNIGAAPSHVSIRYFDQNGSAAGSGDDNPNLPVNASWTVRQDMTGHSFASGGAGSAVVFSDQPLTAFVNEFAPGNSGDATSYTSIPMPSGAATTLFAPAIANGAYGGYTTGIGLVSLAATVTNLTIDYRGASGNLVKTQAVNNIAPGAYRGIYSGDPALGLPAGFAGTATILSSAGVVAAVVNETGPGGQFSSYDAVPTGSTKLFAPAALNNAYGGYFTGMAIQNTTANAGTVTVDYFNALGAATTKNFNIAPNGYLGIYQGSAADGPAPGANTARLTATVPVAAIVNEVAPVGAGPARQSTAYNTFPAGAGTLHLPLVESVGSDGWSTGEGIMNTGVGATTVTVSYHDTATGNPLGTPQSQLLQPNAFWGLYQPTGGLPSGSRATAVVTTTGGGQVAVICNESNPTTFMSYNGQ